MAEDPAIRVERLEKAYLDLQEMLAKSYDDISQMMEMLKMLTREKQSVETSNSQTEITPVDAPFFSGYSFRFNFCWTSDLFRLFVKSLIYFV